MTEQHRDERRAADVDQGARRPLTAADLATPRILPGESQSLYAAYQRPRSLAASLTLGGTGFQLVLARCWPVGVTGDLTLVLALPDGVTVQCRAVVLRCGPFRMLLEAREMDTATLALIQRSCAG